MDLIDRYLNAVGFWLPKDRKADILRELAEDIRSEAEEKESGLGRSLTEPEVDALLKSRGRPFEMAGRFLPGRHLIGPTFFPMYVFALKLAAWIGLGVAVILPLALAYLLPSRSASPLDVLARSIHSLWTLALTWFAMITLGFAVAENAQGRSGKVRDWSPARLPAVKNGLKVPRASALADLVVSLLFLSWWLGSFRIPGLVVRGGEPLTLAPSPLWLDLRGRFLVPIALLILAGAALAAVSLVRPQLDRWRVAARAALDAASAGTLVWVLAAHGRLSWAAWKSVRGLKDAAAGTAKVEALRDWGLANVLLIIAIGSLISCAFGLVKLVRWKSLEAKAASR